VDEKPDFGSTTAVVVWARRRLTPKVLWSAIGGLVTVLVVVITWLVNTQSDIRQLKDSVAESKKAGAETRLEHQQDNEMLHNIDTRLAVMNSQLNNIADKVDRQQQWRDKIEGVAELPPHARRRPK
jgi:septal ring factor EnvC (AmiA/AmiB activator)